MSEEMAVSDDQAIELLAFLVTSSRGVIDEPELYGSFRLMDAAGRLLGFILENGKGENEAFFRQMRDRIDSDKMLMMTNEEGYKAFVEDMVRSVTRWLTKRAS